MMIPVDLLVDIDAVTERAWIDPGSVMLIKPTDASGESGDWVSIHLRGGIEITCLGTISDYPDITGHKQEAE